MSTVILVLVLIVIVMMMIMANPAEPFWLLERIKLSTCHEVPRVCQAGLCG